MDGFGDWADRVGTSPQQLKLPHTRPETAQQHAENAVHVERAINDLPLHTPWVFQVEDPVTVPGGETLTLPTLRMPAGQHLFELYLEATSAANINGYTFTLTPAAIESFPLNNTIVDGSGTTTLNVTQRGYQRYASTVNVTPSLALDVTGDVDAEVLWIITATPAKVYQF